MYRATVLLHHRRLADRTPAMAHRVTAWPDLGVPVRTRFGSRSHSSARGAGPCELLRNGLSTCLTRWLAACGGGCRCRGPRGRDVASAVRVAGHRDTGCAGEDDP